MPLTSSPARIEFIRKIARPIGHRRFVIDGLPPPLMFYLVFDGQTGEDTAEGSFDVLIGEPGMDQHIRLLREATVQDIFELCRVLKIPTSHMFDIPLS